mmetsp:Transcript_36823/g.53839  ORF Transcript_36823/g.53839 Transcript_36823/m.53839 type:complete len:90 (-) Transcript_36823:246-515(-)
MVMQCEGFFCRERKRERKEKKYIPAGKLNTPAPTILLTKLKIKLGIVAVPSPCTALLSVEASPPPRWIDVTVAVLRCSFRTMDVMEKGP